MCARFRARSRRLKTMSRKRRRCFSCFSRTQGRRISRELLARRGRGRARWSTGWRAITARNTNKWARLRLILQARIPAAPSWAIGFECKGMRATRERLSARWRREGFSAGSRHGTRKGRCRWLRVARRTDGAIMYELRKEEEHTYGAWAAVLFDL